VDDETPVRLKWKPSFKSWGLSSGIGLSILALASWHYPALRPEAPFLALWIVLTTAGSFIGMRGPKDIERLFGSPLGHPATPLKDQSGWQRFFTLLVYRKHSPVWANVLFFTGCTVIYIAIFGFFFGIPNGIFPFTVAVVVNLIPSLIPCMIWNFFVLFLVATVDYIRGSTPELDDEKTWLLRQVRNMY